MCLKCVCPKCLHYLDDHPGLRQGHPICLRTPPPKLHDDAGGPESDKDVT